MRNSSPSTFSSEMTGPPIVSGVPGEFSEIAITSRVGRNRHKTKRQALQATHENLLWSPEISMRVTSTAGDLEVQIPWEASIIATDNHSLGGTFVFTTMNQPPSRHGKRLTPVVSLNAVE